MTGSQQAAEEQATTIPADWGQVSEEMSTQLEVVDAFKTIPSVTPGKDFVAGRTLAGYFVATKRCYSEKLAGNKRDATGKKYRDLHIFRDAKGNKFGIWGVGVLDFTMGLIAPNQYMAITYNGKEKVALKQGQTPPHSFTFKGVGIDLDAEKMAQAREMAANDDHEALN